MTALQDSRSVYHVVNRKLNMHGSCGHGEEGGDPNTPRRKTNRGCRVDPVNDGLCQTSPRISTNRIFVSSSTKTGRKQELACRLLRKLRNHSSRPFFCLVTTSQNLPQTRRCHDLPTASMTPGCRNEFSRMLITGTCSDGAADSGAALLS